MYFAPVVDIETDLPQIQLTAYPNLRFPVLVYLTAFLGNAYVFRLGDGWSDGEQSSPPGLYFSELWFTFALMLTWNMDGGGWSMSSCLKVEIAALALCVLHVSADFRQTAPQKDAKVNELKAGRKELNVSQRLWLKGL